MSKTLQQYDHKADAWTALAEFELVGEGVKCTYHDILTRRMIERDGVYVGSKTFYPEDGQAFLNALGVAFARSSFLRVVDNDAGGPGKAEAETPTTGK